MRSGFGRIDDSIQRRAREIRAEQGEQAAREFQAREYKEAAKGTGQIAAGAAAGAAIGSVVPVIGTVAGALVGMWAGAGVALYRSLKDSDD